MDIDRSNISLRVDECVELINDVERTRVDCYCSYLYDSVVLPKPSCFTVDDNKPISLGGPRQLGSKALHLSTVSSSRQRIPSGQSLKQLALPQHRVRIGYTDRLVTLSLAVSIHPL